MSAQQPPPVSRLDMVICQPGRATPIKCN